LIKRPTKLDRMAHAVCRLRSQSTTLRSVTTRVRSTHSNEDKDAIVEYQRKYYTPQLIATTLERAPMTLLMLE
jgi:hypothetical protein